MFNRLLFILQLVLISGFFSCRSLRPVVSSYNSAISAEDYINTYKDLAIREMKRTGVPASITLAQGMVESDYGRSRLAREANNHFGIKCHDDWTGARIRHNDDRRNECFRSYQKAEESYYDHSDFLRSGSRYSFLFEIDPADYKEWARGLKKAGYATNPDYANMLIRKIEENNLWYFDREDNTAGLQQQTTKEAIKTNTSQDSDTYNKPVPSLNGSIAVNARVPRVMENNRIEYIIVRDGDTREKLEKDFNLLRWELPKYNELSSDFSPIPGQVLYLQPKRDKSEPGKEYYNTVEGDTMYLISQLYGIKLKRLYEMNRMEDGTEPEAGQKIWLRNIKPVGLR